MSNILILAAHPDDESLGCGATIAKLASEGHQVTLLTFTDGVSARNNNKAANRNNKLDLCASILGIHSYKSGNFPDNQMDTVPLLDVCKFIENSIDSLPDIIFTHHSSCLNIDHQIVARATNVVFRPSIGHPIKIYAYYVPSSTDYDLFNTFDGRSYFEVKDYKDIKLKCLKMCYNEEMRDFPHSRSYENVENLMKVWGAEVGVEYAEKFKLLKEVL